MKKLKRILSFVLCLVMVVTVIQVTPQNVYAAKKIKLDKTKLTMYVGEKEYLRLYKGKYWTSAKWSSSNKKVATVNKYGYIKALKSGTVKITAKYKNKKYVCKLTVKDALKDHVSYEIIDVPENRDLNRNNLKAIKITNDNDIAIEFNVTCKYYDKDGFFLNSKETYYRVNGNSYTIAPIKYDEYTIMDKYTINKIDPIDVEYSISDPYTDGVHSNDYIDIIFSNNSNKDETINHAILYYNSKNEVISIYNFRGRAQIDLPAHEKVKITPWETWKVKENNDIQRVEVYVY